MKVSSVFFIAAASVFSVALANNSCASIRYRKEIHDLSQQEVTDLIDAMLELKNRPSKADPSVTMWDDFALRHAKYHQPTHDHDMFLPYHRLFTLELEDALRTIKPALTMPYWNAPYDAYAPFTSAIWQIIGQSQLETDGTAGCVPNGPFSSWKATYPDKTDCVRRGFSPTAPVTQRLWNQEEVAGMIRTNGDFAKMRQSIEYGIHGQMHNIGTTPGTMSNMYSPFDVLFFFTHSYIEYLWVSFQKAEDKEFKSYPDLNAMIPYYNVPVSSVMDYTQYCYDYYLPNQAGMGDNTNNNNTSSSMGSATTSESVSATVSITTSASDSILTSTGIATTTASATGSESTSASVSATGSDSVSVSATGSDSASVSATGSDSASVSATGSDSASVSATGSDSVSVSATGSDSASASVSATGSDSASYVITSSSLIYDVTPTASMSNNSTVPTGVETGRDAPVPTSTPDTCTTYPKYSAPVNNNLPMIQPDPTWAKMNGLTADKMQALNAQLRVVQESIQAKLASHEPVYAAGWSPSGSTNGLQVAVAPAVPAVTTTNEVITINSSNNNNTPAATVITQTIGGSTSSSTADSFNELLSQIVTAHQNDASKIIVHLDISQADLAATPISTIMGLIHSANLDSAVVNVLTGLFNQIVGAINSGITDITVDVTFL
ncbi:hypothetical protein IWQ60_010047 [Tieghemiomyces parasiticus]|uniref:Tyrosinase copper-binding domain-containing protein n=1 Tax=Tieghemiomyces parasiticus TaxID=78921 RepID=A0A9W7ZRQ5_9FUNG|nr:hypothetical protein IWQ60_010047 [Tieghemiomyces parasiticus]